MNGKDYAKIMNGLGQIPGMDFIPGVSRSGYKPEAPQQTESKAAPAPSGMFMMNMPKASQVKFEEEKEEAPELTREDKKILLQALKHLFENHASSKAPLTESADVFSQLDQISQNNSGNYYLQKTLGALSEAVHDFDLARGHLKMVIKNTAEYIKSM